MMIATITYLSSKILCAALHEANEVGDGAFVGQILDVDMCASCYFHQAPGGFILHRCHHARVFDQFYQSEHDIVFDSRLNNCDVFG